MLDMHITIGVMGCFEDDKVQIPIASDQTSLIIRIEGDQMACNPKIKEILQRIKEVCQDFQTKTPA